MILPYDMPAHVLRSELEDCEQAAEAALSWGLDAWPWIKRAALCRIELRRAWRAWAAKTREASVESRERT